MADNEVTVYCPICPDDDAEMVLTERDIKNAIRHRDLGETEGKLLGYCKKHGHVFVLAGPDMPQKTSEVQAWIPKAKDDPDTCCPCIPLLDSRQATSPSGSTVIDGEELYLAGDPGSGAMREWVYMAKYGKNPRVCIQNNPDMGGEPTVIGKRVEKKVKK
jgi:hypothetical protein